MLMLLYHLPQDMICYVNVAVSPVVVSPTTGYDMLC